MSNGFFHGTIFGLSRRATPTLQGVVFNFSRGGLPFHSGAPRVATSVPCGLVGQNEVAIEVLANSKTCMVSSIRARIAFLTGTAPEAIQEASPVPTKRPVGRSQAYQFSVTLSGGYFPVVTATTDLPEGTVLFVLIRKPWLPDAEQRIARGLPACGGDCYPATAGPKQLNGATVEVRDGKFVAGPFSFSSQPFPPGSYPLQISLGFSLIADSKTTATVEAEKLPEFCYRPLAPLSPAQQKQCADMRVLFATMIAVPSAETYSSGPALLGPAVPAVGTAAASRRRSSGEVHCESIPDKHSGAACFLQAGVPVVDCDHPRNADDTAFCREVLRRDRNAAPTASGNVIQPEPPPHSDQSAAARALPNAAATVYRSRFLLAGFLLRAGKVCGGDFKRTIEAGLDLIATSELKRVSEAYPDTTGQWMQEGANNLNTGVMQDGIEEACAFANTVRARAEEMVKTVH